MEISEKLEKWLIENIWWIALIFWLVTIEIYILHWIIWETISVQSTITIIWTIFAFWYWYKKYERDKELEIIEKYTKKYNDIYNDIINNLLDSENEVKTWKINFIKILNLWYEEYFLYKQWYISDSLWLEWSFWIKEDIYMFMDKSYKRYKKLTENEKNENDWINSITKWSELITSIWYFINHSKNKTNNKLVSYSFTIFFKNIIKEYVNKKWDINKSEKEWNKIIKKVLDL